MLTESLRKYPPVTNLTRMCGQDYTVEGTDWTIKKGQLVVIPANSIQHDAEYYPDPEKFDPDRFSPEEMAKRNPYAFLPFGEGARVCIGLRFGMMQARMGMALLLSSFRFEPCAKSVTPIKFINYTFILSPEDGVSLQVTRI